MRFRNSIILPAVAYIAVLIALLIFLMVNNDKGGSFAVIVGGVAILHVLGGAIYFFFWIYLSLRRLNKRTKRLKSGMLNDQEKGWSNGELQEIEVHLTEHQKRLKAAVNHLNQLAEGTVQEDFQSLDDNDELGNALVKLGKRIDQTTHEAAQRQILDEQQNWASQGVAKFGAILRDEQENADAFGVFIRELVRYVDAEVGGVYLLQSDDSMVLQAAYAFDREKKAQGTFAQGEGLVGRCMVEQAAILITEVPSDYIKIRSGMGEDRPAMLFLVPVWFDNRVIGVLEIASFDPLEEYKRKFIEELGKNIGSSMTRVQASSL